MTEPMNDAEIAAMVADLQAGTPGPWTDRLEDIEDSEDYSLDRDDDSNSGLCYSSVGAVKGSTVALVAVPSSFGMDDELEANTSRIKRVPAMEQTILALQAQLADTQEAYDDTKRLARKIDIAMHGVEGAAKQASLCDLVHPAADLRAQLASMTESRDAALARVRVLTEALKKIRDVESYVKHESFFGDPGRVDITPYTKTGEIARSALAEGTPPMTDSKPSGVAWRWKSKDGSIWFYDPDPEWLSRQSPDEIDAEQLFLHPAQPDPVGYALAIEQAAAAVLHGRTKPDDNRTWIGDRPYICEETAYRAIRAISPPADRLAAVLAMPEVRALVELTEKRVKTACDLFNCKPEDLGDICVAERAAIAALVQP